MHPAPRTMPDTPHNPKSYKTRILAGVILATVLLFTVPTFITGGVAWMANLRKLDTELFWISRLLFWICLGLVWLYAVKIEKQKLLIWEDRDYPFWFYPASIISIFGVLIVGLAIITGTMIWLKVPRSETRTEEMLEVFRQNRLLMIFTLVTAGVVEELIFRGYIQSRLEILFRNPWPGIILSSALFALLHFGYGNAYQIAGPFYIGFVFAVFYWKFKNLKVLILFHTLWDVLAMLTRL
jgi:uncharacterized protein